MRRPSYTLAYREVQQAHDLEATLRQFDPAREKVLPEILRLNVASKWMTGMKVVTAGDKKLQASDSTRDAALLPFLPADFEAPAYYLKLTVGEATYLYDVVQGKLIASHAPQKLTDVRKELAILRELKNREMRKIDW